MGKPVASRDESRIIMTLMVTRVTHDPVRKQPPLAHVKDDLSWRNFGYAGALNGNQIAGKNGRYHARAKHTETDCSKSADDFIRQDAR